MLDLRRQDAVQAQIDSQRTMAEVPPTSHASASPSPRSSPSPTPPPPSSEPDLPSSPVATTADLDEEPSISQTPRTRPSDYLQRRCPLCFGGEASHLPDSRYVIQPLSPHQPRTYALSVPITLFKVMRTLRRKDARDSPTNGMNPPFIPTPSSSLKRRLRRWNIMWSDAGQLSDLEVDEGFRRRTMKKTDVKTASLYQTRYWTAVKNRS